jgi:small subunit ribosomal protein S5
MTEEKNIEQTKVEVKKEEGKVEPTKSIAQNSNNNTTKTVDKQRKYQQRNNRKRFRRPKREYEEKIIDIARVTNVVKGGRRFSFSVYVVIGNKKGKVGIGHGKSAEVPDAIKKAIKNAQKNIIMVPIIDRRTIPHQLETKFRASRILIKPAPKGKGIIASGTVRAVVELAGYQDIYTKTYGSRNKANISKATIHALEQLRTAKQIAILRDKEISEIV